MVDMVVKECRWQATAHGNGQQREGKEKGKASSDKSSVVVYVSEREETKHTRCGWC